MNIGHNNPPADADAVFALDVDDLFTLLSDTLAGGEVDSDERETAIDKIADDFHRLAKDADKARAAEKKPHDDASKAVQAKWKPVIDKAERGKKACLDAITPYRTAKQRAKDEAARRAREEAAERERLAQEALRQSDDLEARFQAEQDLETAKKLNATANRIDRSATGLRTYWEAELTSARDAMRWLLLRDPAEFIALTQRLVDAEARGARPPIPGVIYHERKRAA